MVYRDAASFCAAYPKGHTMPPVFTPSPVADPGRRTFFRSAAIGSAVAGVTIAGGLSAGLAQTAATPADLLGGPTDKIDIAALPRVRQALVAPPFAPEHEQVAVGGPKVVEVTMTIREKKIEIDDEGTTIWAYTYEGSVPGPLIVCHQGDYVELTLKSDPSNMLEHNIDFHAATGAMGGGELTLVMPGEQVRLRFRAIKAGVFVYHCAPGGEMTPLHVCHGMNGAIMVLPRDGLKSRDGTPIRYDKVFYIGEQDFYIPKDEAGDYVSYEGAMEDYSDSLAVMRGLIPTHVVFNGRAGALTGDAALTATVGETVLFIHAQANRDTRPHLIGGHGDFVWETGSFNDPCATDLETWFICGGSAGAMVYTFRQPGLYAYVNHNLIEAILLGAAAHVQVEGEWDNALMEQTLAPVAF